MTKFEMQQHLNILSAECSALRAECSALRAQLTHTVQPGREGFKAQLAALKSAGKGAKLVGGKLVTPQFNLE